MDKHCAEAFLTNLTASVFDRANMRSETGLLSCVVHAYFTASYACMHDQIVQKFTPAIIAIYAIYLISGK